MPLCAVLALTFGCGDPSGSDDLGNLDGGGVEPGDGGSGGGPGYDIVFDSNVLHEIQITVDDGDLDALESDRENRVPCTFSFDGVELSNVGVRQKGGLGSSSTLDGKPGFSVKFNEFVAGQKLHGLRKLLLNNALEDATLLSEHIGYESYRLAGRPATFTAHAVVTLNGRVYGVYVVKEPINVDFLERSFGSASADGNVYEGNYHPDDQQLGDFVIHPEELDLKDEVEDMRSRAGAVALAAAIRDTPDAQFSGVVSGRLDLDGYITSLALDTVLGYWDSYAYFLNNYYLYDNPADGRFVYLPHGMDQLQYETLSAPFGELADRIEENAALDAQFRDEIARVRSTFAVAALQARIDRVDAILHATPRTESAVLEDIASFDSRVDGVRAAISAIPNQ